MGNWIKGAVKHPGREQAAAARAGESTHAYMEGHKDASGSAGAAARLGLRFEHGLANGGLVEGSVHGTGEDASLLDGKEEVQHGPVPQQKDKSLSERAKALFGMKCRGLLARPGE